MNSVYHLVPKVWHPVCKRKYLIVVACRCACVLSVQLYMYIWIDESMLYVDSMYMICCCRVKLRRTRRLSTCTCSVAGLMIVT